jgi:hypothetical protein
MVSTLNQMVTGKAFEYVILLEFQEKLTNKTKVEVIKNSSYKIAKECFEKLSTEQQGIYLLTASFSVNFLIDIEPKLSNGIDDKDILQLEIQADSQGEIGDIRDIIIIRSLDGWEIGVSAKNNHKAVKHSRLSSNIDFGEKWLGVGCSQEYFDNIDRVFMPLRKIKSSNNSQQKWSSLDNKEDNVYVPVLKAFKQELFRIYNLSPESTAVRLISYLVGNKDFYKVIKGDGVVEIQAYNLYGTLNLPFQHIQPKYKTPIVQLPSEVLEIDFKPNSKTTLIVKLNNNWKLSFRIHNASSKVEPSLKFDISLLSAPNSLFVNKLSIK